MPSVPPPALPAFLWHVADMYNAYIFPYLPDPLQSLSSSLAPMVTSALSAASNGDVVSLAAFLLAVYLTLKIAEYIRRSVVAWMLFLFKLALVALLVNAAFYVNQYGWQKALNDAQWAFGILWSLLEDRVMSHSDGRDNRTGWNGGNLARDGAWNPYGGGRQQVPVARGGSKKRGGWT